MITTSSRETAIVASLLEADGELPQNLARLLEHAPDSFLDMRCGQVARAIHNLRLDSRPVSSFAVAPMLTFADSTAFLVGLSIEAVSLVIAEEEARPVWEEYHTRKAASLFSDAAAAINAKPQQAKSVVHCVRQALEDLGAESGADHLKDRLYNPDIEPPAARPVYTLGGHAVSTPGNLTTITSAVKTGKSAAIGGMCASAMASGFDFLGFGSSNDRKSALVWVDTEQSKDDSWHCVTRSIKRAGLSTRPPWLIPYCLTGFNAEQSWRHVQQIVRTEARKHGGVHSVLIDGIADLVNDVNDSAECNGFVSQLHGMAIEYDCPIICVIHLNPGTEKSRGHLGSQLERKAESNLRLDKDGDVTTIWSEKQRRAPISKAIGPCFRWDDAAGMHIATETRQQANHSEEIESYRMLAEDIFSKHPSMRYAEVVTTVKNQLAVSQRTAERKVAKMANLSVIKKSVAGLWTKTT